MIRVFCSRTDRILPFPVKHLNALVAHKLLSAKVLKPWAQHGTLIASSAHSAVADSPMVAIVNMKTDLSANLASKTSLLFAGTLIDINIILLITKTPRIDR